MAGTRAEQEGIQVFDLQQCLPFQDKGASVQLLSEKNGMRLVGLALRTGHTIKEHHNPSRLTVQVVEGELIFSAAGQDVHLHPGVVLQIDANVPHHLHAETDARLLLFMEPNIARLPTEDEQ